MSIQKELKSWMTLFICILVIPIVEGFGILSVQIRSFFGFTDRPFYWSFVISTIIVHWFGVILIYKSLSSPSSYLNLNPSYFYARKYQFVFVILLIAVFSYFAPIYLYSEQLPPQAIILRSIGPVNGIERLAFVALAITAGVCEEIIFRGYLIGYLEKLTRKKWLALVLSSFSFMAIHGVAYLPVVMLIQYFIIGLIFGWFFQKYRRLEYLILVHALIDLTIPLMFP